MRSTRGFVAGMVFGVLCCAFAADVGGLALARQDERDEPETHENDHPELARLYDEDQADRMPEGGKAIDWESVSRRDRMREARVKDLYEAGELRTGKDYERAAMVLQHASKPEDYLLAHEFCVAALAKGEKEARWLAAATEDRFLMNIGRPQRFGTQYRSAGPDEPVKLYEVEPGVTDGLRRELGVPTLAEAREREAEIQESIRGEKAKTKGNDPDRSAGGRIPGVRSTVRQSAAPAVHPRGGGGLADGRSVRLRLGQH